MLSKYTDAGRMNHIYRQKTLVIYRLCKTVIISIYYIILSTYNIVVSLNYIIIVLS